MTTTARLKIGDVAQQTGVSVGTLRYYETLKLLYPIERGDNGYRYYSMETVQQVQFIKKAQSLGFSLDEIRQILDVRDRGGTPCDLVQDLLVSKIEQLNSQIFQMTMFRAELKQYRDRWAGIPASQQNDSAICPLIATVSAKTNSNPKKLRSSS
ncbi:MAG: heavy metal-responsive transcriptional regulator [Scytolyngbya sp. HA4215-MV1]|jgi:DNA-binding transcriptional MerR regulator|nr:heavy metal-responsive transcriptional regulator [Scytolyngbya sp. HA4215-MV1]